jgi:hypothetical protein
MIAKPDASIVDANSPECHATAGRGSTDVARKSADNGPCKVLLPRRPGESRFAPPQYYYPVSRSGVMPSERFAA